MSIISDVQLFIKNGLWIYDGLIVFVAKSFHELYNFKPDEPTSIWLARKLNLRDGNCTPPLAGTIEQLDFHHWFKPLDMATCYPLSHYPAGDFPGV